MQVLLELLGDTFQEQKGQRAILFRVCEMQWTMFGQDWGGERLGENPNMLYMERQLMPHYCSWAGGIDGTRFGCCPPPPAPQGPG